ncbi:SIR2 family protein [Haliovirga abyssi]|uniref:SIR2-like domain-containing protein n=1 Tax=Haliovirga abyssi TaxID=2996794 RepID=A0AAU9DDE6_9FUSO|nr:SIR2 family protein [Haliovirga abyssi]BDU51370.1 hypothetical protein HLVA_19390 [Haliovirga abyssi]
MNELEKKLYEQLKKFDSLPFLFVGSGLSRRYLKIEDWENLLRKFAKLSIENAFAYEIYKEKAKNFENKNGINPKIAELIERDFNLKWFKSPEFKKSRKEYAEDITKGISPLKIEIAKYFKNVTENLGNGSEIEKKEIEWLKEISKKSISGVITTNYDTLIDEVFTGYKIYIGQEELIFSTLQGTAEIYKIHGCCSKPESIVITENDYKGFNDKNAYLSAKLLTIFLEHPIVFLGYSINDKNVEDILKSITNCLSEENLEKLRDRLIFIEWNNTGKEDEISTFSKVFSNGKRIEMTRVFVKDFNKIYKVLSMIKSKYNPRILRKLKEEIYELVLTNDPKEKMRVVGFDDETKIENIEVVMGVGIINDFSRRGYERITAVELYEDIVFNKEKFDNFEIVTKTLPELLKHNSGSVPIFKYLQGYQGELPERVKEELEKRKDLDSFLSRTFKDKKLKNINRYKSINEIKEDHDDLSSMIQVLYLGEKYLNEIELDGFLKELFEKYPDILFDSKMNTKTNIKRLIKIYDWLKYSKK